MARPLTLPESLFVRLPAGTLDALRKAAERAGVTPQQMARTAIVKASGVRLAGKDGAK